MLTHTKQLRITDFQAVMLTVDKVTQKSKEGGIVLSYLGDVELEWIFE